MMLAEEGRISLDDPVARWIPSWRELTVYRAGQPGAFVDAAGRCADARHRPDAPHLGPDLRLPEPHQRRRRVPQPPPRRLRGGEPRGAGRRTGARAARVLAGQLVELRRLDRRRRPPREPRVGPAVRRVRAHAHPRAARHARHRLPRPRGEARALRRLLRAIGRRHARAGAARQLPRTAARALGRRRPGRHRGRLPALLRDAAPRRRARRRAPRRPEDARPHAHEPPARRQGHRRPRAARHVLGGRLPGAWASASASRW